MRRTVNIDSVQVQHYRMLSRLEQDCLFYLGCGMRDARYSLYWKDEKTHIREMLRVYGNIKIKPEWIDVRRIIGYAWQMGVRVRFRFARVVADRIVRAYQGVLYEVTQDEG